MRRWGAKKADLAEGVILVDREWTADREPVSRPEQDCGGDIDTFLNYVKDWTRGRPRSLLTLIPGTRKARGSGSVAGRVEKQGPDLVCPDFPSGPSDTVLSSNRLGVISLRAFSNLLYPSVPHSSFFTFTAGMFAAQSRLVSSESN